VSKQDDLYADAAATYARRNATEGIRPASAGVVEERRVLRASAWTSLERERTVAEQAWLWFLLPGAISELSLVAGMLYTGVPATGVAVIVTFVLAVFWFAFTRSRRQARRLRAEIDALPDPGGSS
jgi:cbb3-type cytochrome oxidase subunit 3